MPATLVSMAKLASSVKCAEMAKHVALLVTSPENPFWAMPASQLMTTNAPRCLRVGVPRHPLELVQPAAKEAQLLENPRTTGSMVLHGLRKQPSPMWPHPLRALEVAAEEVACAMAHGAAEHSLLVV